MKKRVQARNKYNKLGLMDNRVLYIVGLRFDTSGYCCILFDKEEDREWIVNYKDYHSFLNDFNVLEEDEELEEYREFW